MIVNANKFQAVIMGKRRDHTSENILIDQKNVKVLSTIKLLGVQLDDNLISTCILMILASLVSIN